MKTKLLLYIAVSSSLLLGTTSCSDFLDEKNKTGETADITYATKSGIEGLISSCYAFQRGWYGKEPALGLTEGGTDLFYYGFDNKQKSMNSYNISSVSLEDNVNDNPCLDEYWEMGYACIDVCNNALKYSAQCDQIDDATKAKYKGEAEFIRALTYFNMVNMWGAIPYNDAPITAQNTNPIRMPENEVYGKILADLDNAITDLAAVTTKASGHATVWSARSLKARVLLYAASWINGQLNKKVAGNDKYSNMDAKALYAAAATEADAVITGSGATLYSNYSDLWSMNNEDWTKNNEALFGVSYSSDLKSTVNCIPPRYGSNSEYNSLITRTGYSRGGSSMLLMFVPMWNNGCNDLGGNGTKNTCVFFRATDDGNTITSKKTGQNVAVAEAYSPYGRGFTRYLPSLHLWRLLAKHQTTDQRYQGTMLDAYRIAKHALSQNAQNYSKMGDWADKNITDANKLQAFRDTAIYYSILDGDSQDGKALQAWAKNRYRIQFATGGDIPVYTSTDESKALPTTGGKAISSVYNDGRYNDPKIEGYRSFPCMAKFLDNVYDKTSPTYDISYRDFFVLRLAEMYLIKAEGQLQSGSASDALATINALRKTRAISGQDNSLSSISSIDDILEERGIELCGEFQRWFDLKRTGKLIEYVKKYNAQGSANIDSHHLYRPIPDAETNSVTNLTTEENSTTGFWQNKGY